MLTLRIRLGSTPGIDWRSACESDCAIDLGAHLGAPCRPVTFRRRWKTSCLAMGLDAGQSHQREMIELRHRSLSYGRLNAPRGFLAPVLRLESGCELGFADPLASLHDGTLDRIKGDALNLRKAQAL